jgi:hypothetical protein
MQAPANLPSSLSAPLQSMTAVAVVQTPRSKLQTASGEPDTAFAAANGTVSRSSPPKKRASRAEAQDRAEARAGHTPVQPKLDTVSRTARQTRDSPKQVEPCSPRSAGSPRTTSAEPEAPRVDTSDRSRGINSRSVTQAHPRPSHVEEPSPPRSNADQAPSHRRGNATGTSRFIAETTYRTIRFVRSQAR